MMNKILFLLEDNLELSSRVERMAEQVGFRTITARCIEDAKKLCSQQEQIDFALIDIMVPSTREELREVDDQLNDRNAKAVLMTQAATEADRKTCLTEMSSIDATTRRLIDSEGGVKFLESSESGNLRNRDVRIAVFSAIKSTPGAAESGSLRERLQAALRENSLEVWFEKPCSLQSLRAWLISNNPQPT